MINLSPSFFDFGFITVSIPFLLSLLRVCVSFSLLILLFPFNSRLVLCYVTVENLYLTLPFLEYEWIMAPKLCRILFYFLGLMMQTL